MGLRSWFRNVLRALTPPPVEKKPLPSGRISVDSATQQGTLGTTIVAPTDPEQFWKFNNVDTTNIGQYSPKELIDMLIDLSPEMSYALWQFQRMCNSGWEYKVYNLTGDKVPNEQGKLIVDIFFALLKDQYGSPDVILNRYFLNAFVRGAFCGEIVFAAGGIPVDLAAPDPFSIRFRQIKDPARGTVWQPGQVQGSKFVPLDIPTFKYIPVDPAPASPYGRSLASPAVFTAVFALSVLHDIKRVIMQQGYKRMDISMATEQAMDSFTFDPQGYANLGDYMRAAIDAIKTTYAALQPDDALVHTDIFTINNPSGTIDSDSIGAIDKIMERLEMMVTRALKANGVVMDTSNNTNETDANRKWEIYVAGIKSLQHLCESMLESQLNLAIQNSGNQAYVEFRFAELRAAEMYRDEQTRTLKIMNSNAEYNSGYISQDEAALKTVNHLPVSQTPLAAGIAPEQKKDDNAGNEKNDDKVPTPKGIRSPTVSTNGHSKEKLTFP